MEEGLLLPQLVSMANGPANDAPQHIAPPLVGRRHAIDDEEGAGTDMVGNDPQGLAFEIRGAGDLGGSANQGLKQVNLIVGMHALHDRRQALQPHAGVHGRLGQRRHVALGVAVVLHEHQVPDLDVAVAILLGRARRTAFHFLAMVVKDLGTGTTGTGIAHAPEIVAFERLAAGLVADAAETRGIHADFLKPDVGGLIVLVIDRDPELFRRQAHHFREKFPGELDGLALEIVTKAEVAQHLEERVMTGGVADIFQIVVLAAGTHTALG